MDALNLPEGKTLIVEENALRKWRQIPKLKTEGFDIKMPKFKLGLCYSP